MSIVSNVGFYDFTEAFRNHNRQDNFSIKGLRVLFDWLEELSDDLGEPIELDVIALCCDFQESDVTDIANDYNIDLSEADIMYEVECFLRDRTTVVGDFDNTILFEKF